MRRGTKASSEHRGRMQKAVNKRTAHTLWGASSGVILPPEASPSWVLDHAYLWQALEGDCVVIDSRDVQRYHRLAAHSYVDFLVDYLFTLLICKKILCPVDYQQLLGLQNRRQIVETSDELSGKQYRDGSLLFDQSVIGYELYTSYARSDAKRQLYVTAGAHELTSFDASKAAAKQQLDQIAHDQYEKPFLRMYTRRLLTKCLSTMEIADKLFKTYSVKLRVFDSPEYSVGADLLRAGAVISRMQRQSDFAFVDLGLAKNIREREAAFYGEGFEASLVYSSIASVIDRKLYDAARQEWALGGTQSPNFQKIRECAVLLALETDKHGGLWNSLAWNLLSLAPGLPVGAAAMAVAQLSARLFGYRNMRKDKENALDGLTPSEKFAVISGHISQTVRQSHEEMGWFGWLQSAFRRKQSHDYRWQLSQKAMGSWVETDIYVPWFEQVVEDGKS